MHTEENEILTLDSEVNFEFESTNSGNSGSSRGSSSKDSTGNKSYEIGTDDFNCTLLGSFMGNSGSHEGGIAIYYNQSTHEVYAVQVNKDGDMVTQNSGTTVKAYDVFADSVELRDGEEYVLSVDNGIVKLESADGSSSYTSATNRNATTNAPVASNYFEAGRLFGNDESFVNGLSASEITGNFSEEDEPEPTETEETEETETTEAEDEDDETSTDVTGDSDEATETVFTNSTNTSKNTEITGKETRVVKDLTVRETADGAVVTDANANEANEQATSAVSEIPSPVIVNETPPANGGLLAALIFVAIIAAAAISGCVYFFTKYRKESDLHKEAEDSRHEAQEQYSKLKISYDIAQHGAKQQELLLQDSQNENERLKKELRNSANASASQNEEKLEEYREKAEGWYSEYQRVEAENQRLAGLARQQDERIHALEAAVASNMVAAAAHSTAQEPVEYEDIPEEVLICTSEEQLDLYENVKFLNANVSVTGNVTLTESMGKHAPFVAIDDFVYLNPYFFHDLANGEESYNNLVSIRDVFELDGLRGGSERYGLENVIPAEVVCDDSGTYHIENIGRLTLRTH